MFMNSIQLVVKTVGSQERLAQLLGVTQGMVSAWSTGRKQVAPHWCPRIECVAGGAVTRQELRPDIFGEPNYPNERVQPRGSLKEALKSN